MSVDLNLIANTVELGALSAAQIRIATAIRIAIVFAKLQRDPRPELARRLGSEEGSAHFLNLVGEMGSVWPEPIYVNSPCCPRLSYDEAMVLDLLAAAGRHDRAAFDDFLCEMLSLPARDRLYSVAQAFVQVYTQGAGPGMCGD